MFGRTKHGIDFPENDFRDSQIAKNIFLFRKLAFPENMYFPEIVLRQPNAPLTSSKLTKNEVSLEISNITAYTVYTW